MVRFCDDQSARRSWIENSVLGNIGDEHLILDETIWQKAKILFRKNKGKYLIPILDKEHRLLCFAWQDEEANRELRMLRELENVKYALGFHELFPNYTMVTIHGCNELAWYFAQYLMRRGITVSVDGEFWQELGMNTKYASLSYQNYEIWAEGIHQKSRNWKQERLRSSSVEFECVDEIYEANIQAGNIADAKGDERDLLLRLRGEKEIVIRGTGTKAQDAYDWLLMNGVDICAFQSDRHQNGRKSLYGRPVMKKQDIVNQYKNAVIIECAAKHSAWGFGDVDLYDYEGFERNKRYFLLRDYIIIPENNLIHILRGKEIIFIGDLRLCNRIYKWLIQQEGNSKNIGYWDILNENEGEIDKFQIPKVDKLSHSMEKVYLLVNVVYSSNIGISKEAANKQATYLEKLERFEIYDYTDYFSDMEKSIKLENNLEKYGRKELKPKGILLGAIPPLSGNILFRQSLAGHPQIMVIEEYSFFNNDLYSICIRLAEESANNILDGFWGLIQEVWDAKSIKAYFPNKKAFDREMSEELTKKKYFSSQELFVLFHVAYEKMYRDIEDIEKMVIYWEPHQWNHELVRNFAHWLGSSEIKGFTVCMVRNRYIMAGSSMRQYPTETGWNKCATLYGCRYIKGGKRFINWEERIIKFEELKCFPKEILTILCSWIGISFCNILLKTTFHSQTSYYDGVITGFDTKPAYNLYEEYFTSFDRMRICIIAASYQRQYGYPYVNCLSFSRREIQEMFLKDYRWEMSEDAIVGKNEESIWNMQKRVRRLCWMERFSEILKIDLDEEY